MLLLTLLALPNEGVGEGGLTSSPLAIMDSGSLPSRPSASVANIDRGSVGWDFTTAGADALM